MKYLMAAFLALILPIPAFAQMDARPEVYTSSVCATVYNSTPYKMYGAIETNTFKGPDGTMLHHKETFSLHPEKRLQFCSKGPFFKGEQLEFSLRSLFPVFSCRTGLRGEIVIKSGKTPEGDNKYWADCLPGQSEAEAQPADQ